MRQRSARGTIGPHIGTPQGHEVVDVDAPGPEPWNGEQDRTTGGVGKRGDLREVEASLKDPHGKSMAVASLLPGKTELAQSCLPHGGHAFRGHASQMTEETSVHRPCGGQRHLLLEDDSDESWKAGATSPQGRRSKPVHYAGKIPIPGPQRLGSLAEGCMCKHTGNLAQFMGTLHTAGTVEVGRQTSLCEWNEVEPGGHTHPGIHSPGVVNEAQWNHHFRFLPIGGKGDTCPCAGAATVHFGD